MEAYEQLKQAVSAIEEDVQKAQGGNKAAGVRVRQEMQKVKDLAQEIRKQVLELRGSE